MENNTIEINKKPCKTARAITEELDRQGRTRYWLMKQTELDSPTVYGFLQGTLDCRISTIERMMGTLGMACIPYVEKEKENNKRPSSENKPKCGCGARLR